jgi:hypothetical protein
VTLAAEKVSSVCPAGTSLQIVDSAKSMCLHLKGSSGAGNTFAVSTSVKMPLITMPCAAKGSTTFANQVFEYDDAAGTLAHVASGLLLALQSTPLRDGTALTAVTPNTDGSAEPTSSLWKWFSPFSGGLITSAMDNTFALTAAGAAAAPAPPGAPPPAPAAACMRKEGGGAPRWRPRQH